MTNTNWLRRFKSISILSDILSKKYPHSDFQFRMQSKSGSRWDFSVWIWSALEKARTRYPRYSYSIIKYLNKVWWNWNWQDFVQQSKSKRCRGRKVEWTSSYQFWIYGSFLFLHVSFPPCGIKASNWRVVSRNVMYVPLGAVWGRVKINLQNK